MAGELIDEFGDELETVTLITGESGRFEVTVNRELLFSKKAAGRHANEGEIIHLITKQQSGSQTFADGPNAQIQA